MSLSNSVSSCKWGNNSSISCHIKSGFLASKDSNIASSSGLNHISPIMSFWRSLLDNIILIISILWSKSNFWSIQLLSEDTKYSKDLLS